MNQVCSLRDPARQSGGCRKRSTGCIFAPRAGTLAYHLNVEPNAAGARFPLWLKIGFVWFCIGLFDASRTVLLMRAEGMHHAWTRLFFTLLLAWLPWALATPLIARLAQRYPKPGAQSLFTALMHFTVCAGISVLNSVWAAALEILWNPWAVSPPPRSFPQFVLSYFNSCILSSLILYTAILALCYLLDSSRRLAMQRIETAQLSEQLIRAQLTALQRQIEPHFLFNALNSIAGLVREARNDAAVQMIAGLSDFLREVIQDSNKQQVSLAEEMEFVQKYLQIQKVRFADRLQLSVIFPEELFPAQVPRLILQPIIENAFKHGIAKRAEGGLIRIAASQASDMLQLTVYNDGPKLADSQSITHGVGMASLRARLQNLYGASFDLSMCNAAPCGVEVLIRMPLTTALP
jgi:two-component sensor histidine kinase